MARKIPVRVGVSGLDELLQEASSLAYRLHQSRNGTLRQLNSCQRAVSVLNKLLSELRGDDGPDARAEPEPEIFGRLRADGNYDILSYDSGEAITRLAASVYPVGSDFSARYEHAAGIVLAPEDAEKIGLTIGE